MPLLFLERFPWPSLQTYTALSVALLAGSIFSAYTTVTEQGFGVPDMDEPPPPAPLEGDNRGGLGLEHVTSDDVVGADTELVTTVMWYLVTDSLFVWVSLIQDRLNSAKQPILLLRYLVVTWLLSGLLFSSTQVLVNTACCSLMLIAKMIQCMVFGPLRVSEKQVRLGVLVVT